MSSAPEFEAWRGRLRELAAEIQRVVHAALCAARAEGRPAQAALARGVREGVGDTSFGLDVPAEAAVEAWFAARAAEGPLSLLSEEAGWRHAGPAPGGWRELPDFDHGGPRIVIDPIDGTRPLMHDLRAAWVVLGFAPSGSAQPRAAELTGGLVVELPPSLQLQARWLEAARGGPAEVRVLPVPSEAAAVAAAPSRPLGTQSPNSLQPDPSAVCEGYLTFFRYHPAQRAALAAIEERFFARLAAHEGADLLRVYEDGYCSSGGQLALLALGTYRFVADLRARVGIVSGPCCKPYDIAGALVVAAAAGVSLRDGFDRPLDFPLDATSPLDVVGYATEATRARLGPHLAAALAPPETGARV